MADFDLEAYDREVTGGELRLLAAVMEAAGFERKPAFARWAIEKRGGRYADERLLVFHDCHAAVFAAAGMEGGAGLDPNGSPGGGSGGDVDLDSAVEQVLKHRSVVPLLDLAKTTSWISRDPLEKLKMELRNGTVAEFVLRSHRGNTAIEALLYEYRTAAAGGTPPEDLCNFVFKGDEVEVPEVNADDLVGGGLLNTYKACGAARGINRKLTLYLSHAHQAMDSTDAATRLDLSYVSPLPASPMDLAPLTVALARNTFYTDLVVRDIIQPDAPQRVAGVFTQGNVALTSLTIANTGVKAGWDILCGAWISNPALNLTALNFSSNRLKSSVVSAFCKAMTATPNVTRLELDDCDLSGKVAGKLLKARKTLEAAGRILPLTALDLSRNPIKKLGLRAVAAYVTSGEEVVVEELRVAHTRANCKRLLGALEGATRLRALDISGLDGVAAEEINALLRNDTLEELSVSGCSMKLATLGAIVLSCVSRPGRERACIRAGNLGADLVCNDSILAALATTVGATSNLRLLDLSRNGLSGQQVIDVVAALASADLALEEIDLSGNDLLVAADGSRARSVAALADWLASPRCGVQVLRLAGDHPYTLGPDVVRLAEALAAAGVTSLTGLDLSDNRAGPEALVAATAILFGMPSLVSLWLDGNEVTLDAASEIEAGLIGNARITYFQPPISDFRALHKAGAASLQDLNAYLLSIQCHVMVNCAAVEAVSDLSVEDVASLRIARTASIDAVRRYDTEVEVVDAFDYLEGLPDMVPPPPPFQDLDDEFDFSLGSLETPPSILASPASNDSLAAGSYIPPPPPLALPEDGE